MGSSCVAGPRTYHVNVEDGGASCYVVLVEHALKLVICKFSTLLKAVTAPWLVSSALIFDKLVSLSRVVHCFWISLPYRVCSDSARGGVLANW